MKIIIIDYIKKPLKEIAKKSQKTETFFKKTAQKTKYLELTGIEPQP